MAIINSMAIGKARKSAGALTFSTVKGRTIAREKPAHVRNPQTYLQTQQRTKLSNLVASWRYHGTRLKKLFTVVDGYGSGYNQFVKMNMQFADQLSLDDDGFGRLTEGMFLGNGKYNQNSLSFSPSEGSSSQVVTVTNDSLLAEIKEGDEIGVIAYSSGSNSLKYAAKVLTAADISTLQSTRKITVPLEIMAGPDFFSMYWYSGARGISTTACLFAY